MRTIFAYLDPVTGGALLQVFLGGLAAATLGYQYVRKGVSRVVSRLRGESGHDRSESDTTSV